MNADPLQRLINDWMSGGISPEDIAQLDRRLHEDPSARRMLRRVANLDSALRDWATRREISAAWDAAQADASSRVKPLIFSPLRWPLAAAVALALSVATYHFGTLSAPQPLGPATRVLADGTVVEVNGTAEITHEYTGTERRIRLERGEAHFTVIKDAARPFTVAAPGVTVRAVGTAFNIRVDDSAVEVLVTEGRVSLQPPVPTANAGTSPEQMALSERILAARQRAVVSTARSTATTEIATLTPGEIARVLAWQHRRLEFNATPLVEVVAAFNRLNATQLVVVDPELAALRVSASLRSDNVLGFVKLLETGFGVRAERRGESEILLSAPP